MGKKVLMFFVGVIALLILVGCRTQKVVEVRTIHDSIFQTRDSIVTRYVQDSISEREKTVILTKHDTITGTDTVFVTREYYKDRWRVRTDTIQKVVYINKQSTSTKEVKGKPLKEKKKQWSMAKKSFVVFAITSVLWIIGYLYVRLRR